MKPKEWTATLIDELKLRCKREGYKIREPKLMEIKIDSNRKPLRIIPDSVWVKNNGSTIIFEINQFTGGNYQKTIYGSMLQGLILAKQIGAMFVEIVTKDKNGEKASTICETLKHQYKDLPRFHVIQVSNRFSARKHVQWSLKTQLDALMRDAS